MKILTTVIFAVLLFNGVAAQAAASTAGGCGAGQNTGACSEPQQVASLTRLPAGLRVVSELPSPTTATPVVTAEAPPAEPNVVVLMLVGAALMVFIARRRLD